MKPSALRRPTHLANDCLAFVSGLALTLAFAPFHWHLLGLLCPAAFLWSICQVHPRRALLRGWLFGFGFFATGIGWVYISIKHYGELPAWQAFIFSGLLIQVLAGFYALQGYLYSKIRPKPLQQLLLVFPASWVIVEWFRGQVFTGFPWLLLGYTQTTLPLSSYASIAGVYAVSFVLCLCASILIVFLRSEKNYAIPALFSIVAIWFIGMLLDQIAWTEESKDPIKVSLIQANTEPKRYWTNQDAETNLAIYEHLTQSHWDSDLIIWPENAIPYEYHTAQAFLKEIDGFAKAKNTAIIAGIPTESEKNGLYYNSAVALGTGDGIYHKRNLVPFGEFTPLLTQLEGFYAFLGIPLSNYIRGATQQANLRAKDLSIAAYICYEIAYSKTVLSDFPLADLIVTISNDGWFGDSHAAGQHLQIAQMRSKQTGRYQLFATNTGITAIINPQGKILSEAIPHEATVLDGIVFKTQGLTPWLRWGDWPMATFTALLILSYGLRSWRRKDRWIYLPQSDLT